MDSNIFIYNDSSLLYISFNQDYSCIIAGTERGFKIFNTNPFLFKFERILGGGLGIVEMLYKTNILALVGGGKNPKFTPNRVILWDDYQTKILKEFKFTSSIKNVKLKKEKLIIICDQRIYVYNLDKNYKCLDTIETIENLKGIIGLNINQDYTILAFPTRPKGFVKVKYYEKNIEVDINAHSETIAYLSINNEGTIIATASEKGTIIRFFLINNGDFIDEIKNCHNMTEINYMIFDNTSNFIAICTDKGYINIWSLNEIWEKIYQKNLENDDDNEINCKGHLNNEIKNKKIIFSFLPEFITGGSIKPFAKVRIGEEIAICTFQDEYNLIYITSTGKYFKATINKEKGGKAKLIEEKILYK
jgi:WD40 repeat protein